MVSLYKIGDAEVPGNLQRDYTIECSRKTVSQDSK